MSSLLAILLVVNSTRGHHYLFSYPPNPQRPSSNRRSDNTDRSKDFTVGSSKATRITTSQNDSNNNNSINMNEENRRISNASKGKNSSNNINNNINNSNSNNNSNNNSNSNNNINNDNSTNCNNNNDSKNDDIFAGRDTIFNLDVSFLADALAPKSLLCDRKFQLSMDDLTFVGHPVSLSTLQHCSPHKQQQDKDNSSTEDYDQNPNELSSPISPISPSQFSSPPPPLPSSSSTSQVQQPTTPPSLMNSHRSTENDIMMMEGKDIDDNESLSDTSPGSTSIHMTLFHVVFVMTPPDLELNAQVETLYKNVILRYSSALRYEQLRCGYVQEEIEKVLGLKEEAFSKGTPYDQVMREILRESSLARDIKQIYTAISANTAAHVIINDFIDLSLQIPVIGLGSESTAGGSDRESLLSPTQGNNYNGSLMDIYSVAGYEYDNYPVLCPYHTLLLLEDPEEVLKNMPLDASPTLVQLVQILTPTQSLQELHLLLDCSLAQIYRLAAHLIYWRKAKLIHTISTRNIYVVSPNANFGDISNLENDFKMHIPNLNLPVLLSKLAHPQQYYLVYRVKELKNQYLEAITYLIRKDLVVQLHMYLVLLVPPEKKAGTETPQSQYEGGSQISETNAQSSEVNMSSSPNNSNMNTNNDPEWNRLKRLTYERAPKEVADLFERLKSYMNGQHHIEEIIYREGISRRQLGLVLKYYRDKIVTVYHY